MLHLTLKHCKAIICLSILMFTSVCGSAQYYRHGRLVAPIDPWALNHNIVTMNAIAKQAMFDGIVLRDYANEAICMHRQAMFNRADIARLCAEEIALSATEPIVYDLLSLTNINDRDLRNVGIGLACAHLALCASAIHNAEQANKETAEAQEADTDSSLTDTNNDNQREQRCENKAARALTTLAIIEAAALTVDALFGNYPRAPRHRYHHHYHRHYYPYY